MAKTKILLNINCFFFAKYSCFKNVRVSPVIGGQHRDAPLAYTMGLTNGERPDLRMPVWPYRSNREYLVKMGVPHIRARTHTRTLHFLDGVAALDSLLEFPGEYNITPWVHAWVGEST